MPPIVKICGVTEDRVLAAALDAGADMVGFVFFARSPRNLSVPAAAKLAQDVGTRARRVALTVDADDDTLDALVAGVPLDMLQLHGSETPFRVAAVRRRYGLPVMRALRVGSEADLDKAASYHGAADMLLFDAPARAPDALPGGNGTTFDWTLLRGTTIRTPWLLAGGLNAGNVASAIAATGPSGVDVSSGVESAPGIKDPARIAAFVHAARYAGEDRPEVGAADARAAAASSIARSVA